MTKEQFQKIVEKTGKNFYCKNSSFDKDFYILMCGDDPILNDTACEDQYGTEEDVLDYFAEYLWEYEVQEEEEEKEIPHKEKVTDVNFKSVTGHDVCVRVKRVWEPGKDASFLEVSIDGGRFYSDINSCTTRNAQIFYIINDEELKGENRIIIPDDVYCKIMLLRTEKIVESRGSFDDILLSDVKEFIKEGFVLPKAEIKRAADEQGVKFMFPCSYLNESEMSRLEAFEYLQGHHARGLNGNYRGYMIAEYVDVIKRLYPNEF